jgi:hypothetical protein
MIYKKSVKLIKIKKIFNRYINNFEDLNKVYKDVRINLKKTPTIDIELNKF